MPHVQITAERRRHLKRKYKIASKFVEGAKSIGGGGFGLTPWETRNAGSDMVKHLGRVCKAMEYLAGNLDSQQSATNPSRIERSHRTMTRHIEGLRDRLAYCEMQLNAVVRQFVSRRKLNVREVMWELDTLEATYDSFTLLGVNNDRYQRNLPGVSVTLGPVSFFGEDLGEFTILLRCDHPKGYRAEAEDPNPSANDSDVTHPHISCGELCEGDATVPIDMALRECRLVDFFDLVNSVLHTYNAESAYCRMDEWDGISCPGCGEPGLDEDDCHSCNVCDRSHCDSCHSYCNACDSGVCDGCTSHCFSCDETRCHECMSECSVCSKAECKDCLDESEQCSKCADESEQELEQELEDDEEDSYSEDDTEDDTEDAGQPGFLETTPAT